MTTLTGNWAWGPGSLPGMVVGTYTTLGLSDADNALRVRFVVPKDGTLSKIGVYVNDITGDPPAYNIGFYDTAGSAYGGSAAEAHDFTATGFVWVTLTTPATAAAGDLVEARLEPGATPPDASNSIQVRRNVSPWSPSLPAGGYYTSAWLADTGSLGVLYSDGSVALPGVSERRLPIRTTSTPDEAGALFQVPYACKCLGAALGLQPYTTTAAFDVVLYSAAGAVLASCSHGAKYHGSSAGLYFYQWDEVSLSAGTDYRLAVLPTTTAYVYLSVGYMADVASRQWWPEGERWQLTQRTDAGVWTETDTALPMMALMLSEITLPEAGGSGWSGGVLVG